MIKLDHVRESTWYRHNLVNRSLESRIGFYPHLRMDTNYYNKYINSSWFLKSFLVYEIYGNCTICMIPYFCPNKVGLLLFTNFSSRFNNRPLSHPKLPQRKTCHLFHEGTHHLERHTKSLWCVFLFICTCIHFSQAV